MVFSAYYKNEVLGKTWMTGHAEGEVESGRHVKPPLMRIYHGFGSAHYDHVSKHMFGKKLNEANICGKAASSCPQAITL